MIHLFKLIRFQNLLIIALTQYLMRWCIINPILAEYPIRANGVVSYYKLSMQFSELNFFFLVLSTLCLTAAGYVINDYFDRKTDMVNRPDEVIIDKQISRRFAMILHLVLNTIGIGLGFYISIVIHLWQLGFIYLVMSGVLWYYSTTYKRQFFLGNFIVALLTALVPLSVSLYELPVLNQFYRELIDNYNVRFYLVFYWTAGFAIFAFFTTLVREIIKDLEDFEGDNAYGRNTLPIVLGIQWTKIVVYGLIIITMGGLIAVRFLYLHNSISFYYLTALVLMLSVLIYLVFRAKDFRDYHKASIYTKIVMLIGILYAPVTYLIFKL
jgi:4-hydroxybenzoate polyprenyltransferase